MGFLILYGIAIIIRVGFIGLCCAGIVGLCVFFPALKGYIGTREARYHKKMIKGIAMAIPILTILFFAGIHKLGDAASDRNSIYIQMNSGTTEGMERLLKRGMSADSKATNLENTPAKGNEYTLLTYLASYNSHYDDCVEKARLLLDYGADVDWEACPNCNVAGNGHGQPFCRSTPLLLVCTHPGAHAVELVELFVEYGADVNAVSGEGRTGLDILDEDIYLWRTRRGEVPEDLIALRKTLVKYGAKNKKWKG